MNHPAHIRASHERGLSLLEALVWVGVFTVSMAAVTSTLLMFYKSNRYTLEQAQAVASAQKGIDRMMREMREAAYSSQGAYPIVSIAPNDLVFYADIDADPFIERVHYFLSGPVLMRGIVDPSGDPPAYTGAETALPVAEYVRNASSSVRLFRYFDSAGTEVTDVTRWSSVRFIRATITVNVEPSRAPNEISLTSSAALRNLY